MKKISKLLAVLLAAALCAPAAARNLSGVTVEWAPHYGSAMRDGGAFTVIVKEAFRRGGHSAEVNYIPWQRALSNVEQGTDDFVSGAYFNEERANTYWVSDPVYSIDLGLVAMRSLGVTTVGDNLRGLTPYSIGVSRGYANTEAFDQADFLDKQVAKSPTLNLRKLFRKRIDMMVGAFDIIRYQAQQEDLDTRKMVFIEPPLQSNALHVMISRKLDDGEQLLAAFNEGLASMNADGTLEQMLREYLNRS